MDGIRPEPQDSLIITDDVIATGLQWPCTILNQSP